MTGNTIQSWLPYSGQVLTAVVAAIAILANRNTSRETLTGQLTQRVWERRTEVYLQVIRQTDSVDPHNLRSPEGFRESAESARGEEIPLLPTSPDSDEWREFEATIEAFASGEVRYLYWLWDSAIAAWTMAISGAVVHAEHDSPEREKSRSRVQQTYDMVFHAREELVAQIRAELRFGTRRVDHISYKQDRHFGYLTDLRISGNQRDMRPVRASRMLNVMMDWRGNLHQTIRMGERTEEEPRDLESA